MNDKQRAFVREYLIDRNATQAAIRAGYSEKTAEQQGYQLLQKTSVREAVEQGEQEHAEKCSVTVQDVIRGLHSEATDKGDGTSQSARVTAWAHLGKHLGMFSDKLELTGKDGRPIVFETIYETKPDE